MEEEEKKRADVEEDGKRAKEEEGKEDAFSRHFWRQLFLFISYLPLPFPREASWFKKLALVVDCITARFFCGAVCESCASVRLAPYIHEHAHHTCIHACTQA